MNSLQLISGLLRLQRGALGAADTGASEQLALAANRVSAVARVHQHLYVGDGDGTIDCGFPLGVSNHIVAPTARITVGRGPLLVGWELPKLAGEE